MAETAYHHIRTTAAEAPAGCPVDHTFTPLAPDYVADPYPIAAQMRNESPVVFAEELGYVVVSRMDHVTEVFLNPDVYSSQIGHTGSCTFSDEYTSGFRNTSVTWSIRDTTT